MIDWQPFFPHGTRVAAIPHWKHPALLVPVSSFIQNWERSKLYPAYRPLKKFYKFLLRVKVSLGLSQERQVQCLNWIIEEFTRNLIPSIKSCVVLIGRPSPIQKIKIQLIDEKDKILGYIKYGESLHAKRLIKNEYEILTKLPHGLGPKALKYDVIGIGDAILVTPVIGKGIKATLPPPKDLIHFMNSMMTESFYHLEDHPWVRKINDKGDIQIEKILDPLKDKEWPVAIQHGDFAPWNLFCTAQGTLQPIDWEFGNLTSFPYIDAAYFILQVAALIYHWKPVKALYYAVHYLQQIHGLSIEEAISFVRLSAYDAYLMTLENGRGPDWPLQLWRRAVWETDL